MKIIEEVMLEEYQRTLRIEKALVAELNQLPKGSIQKKKIRGKEYYYLQYRCGETVKSQYVKTCDIVELQKQLNRRRENLDALKSLEKTKSQIEKALGKGFIDEHSTEGIY